MTTMFGQISRASEEFDQDDTRDKAADMRPECDASGLTANCRDASDELEKHPI